jgi:hypothetical protein
MTFDQFPSTARDDTFWLGLIAMAHIGRRACGTVENVGYTGGAGVRCT